jgi:magnesium transporter
MITVTLTNLEQLEQQVRRALETQDFDGLRQVLADRHAADVADVIDRLDEEDQLTVFRLLAPDQAAEVLDETSVEATRELIEQLLPDEAGDLLDRLPMDDVAEILSEDVPNRQQALLAAMEPDDAAEVRALLSYPPQSAGRLMTEKFVQVRAGMTADETIARLRRLDPEIENLNDLYVLDPAQRLVGVVSLRKVITAQPERPLAELMNTRLITATPDTDQEEVARLVSQYDLSALPVVTTEGRMLGIVTVDDVIDVLVQESTEDVLRFGGVEGGAGDQPYFTVPILQAVRRRVGWLMLLFLTGTITVSVLDRFEGQLDQVVALSFFIPLLIGTGGNTGAQTVSTMIRGMALGEIRLRDAGRVIARELMSGLVLGLMLGCVALGLALVWTGGDYTLALVVALTIVAICIWSNTIGALVPLVARKFGLDPALVSAPLITTLVDATGLAIYLMIAQTLLGL